MSPREFEITIRYQRDEYIQFLKTLMAFQVGRDATQKWYFTLFAYPFWLSMYYLKMAQEGLCHFRLNEKGFTRKSKTGESGLNWNGLKKILVHEEFYLLIGKRKGMAPIPKRCLSPEQRATFESWAKAKLVTPNQFVN